MSTYQFYDFYAIDQALTPKQKQEVDGLSSRSTPTARRATFVYHYSDFRHSEEEVLEKYFDIMIYTANWGSFRLMMKIPKELVDLAAIKAYRTDQGDSYISTQGKGDYVVIDLYFNEEDYGSWMDSEGVLDGLMRLREQIINGDYRVLMLAWLHLNHYYHEYEYIETDPHIILPPIPPNLDQLNMSLDNFIYFWRINPDIISAVASFSEPEETISDDTLVSQLAHLSEEDTLGYLKRILAEEPQLGRKLRKQLETMLGHTSNKAQETTLTFSKILTLHEQQEQNRIAKEKEIQAQKHKNAMEKIGTKQAALWKEVYYDAGLKTSTGYKHATATLAKLQAYADYSGEKAPFEQKLAAVVETFSRSRAFLRRLKEHGIRVP